MAAASVPTHDGQPFSIARGWVIATVTADPARQELAMLLLNWLIAPERSGQWTRAAGLVPGTRGALRQWDISDTDRAALRGILEAATTAPPPEVMETAGRAMQTALEALLRRRVSPEDAAASAVEILGQ
jgi:ABC-type glycerol-3-phosphate transport system substrate-binding protein